MADADAGSGPDSGSWQLFAAVAAIFLVAYFIKRRSNPVSHSRIVTPPPVSGVNPFNALTQQLYSIPTIGPSAPLLSYLGAFRYVVDTEGMLREGYKKVRIHRRPMPPLRSLMTC